MRFSTCRRSISSSIRCDEMLQPFTRVVNFENRLFLLDLHRQVSGDGIREPRRVIDAGKRGQNFGWSLLVELDVLLEVSEQGPGQRFNLAPVLGSRVEHRDTRAQVGFPFFEFVDPRPLATFHQDLDSTVREFQELQNGGDRPDSVDFLDGRIVLARVDLRDEQDPLVLLHRLLERLNGSIPADEQGDHHVWIDNDVPQRKHGDHVEHLRRVFSLNWCAPDSAEQAVGVVPESAICCTWHRGRPNSSAHPFFHRIVETERRPRIATSRLQSGTARCLSPS